MIESVSPAITGGKPAEWTRALASTGAVVFAYRVTAPWMPLASGAVIVFGCLDWFRTYWPPTHWRAGWVLTPLLLISGLMLIQFAVQRFRANDGPAVVSTQGISGPKLAPLRWQDIRDVRWVHTRVNRGIYAVVSPEVYAQQPPAATSWDRFGRVVNSRSWNPDERQLVWLERPRARPDDIIAFVRAEIERRGK